MDSVQTLLTEIIEADKNTENEQVDADLDREIAETEKEIDHWQNELKLDEKQKIEFDQKVEKTQNEFNETTVKHQEYDTSHNQHLGTITYLYKRRDNIRLRMAKNPTVEHLVVKEEPKDPELEIGRTDLLRKHIKLLQTNVTLTKRMKETRTNEIQKLEVARINQEVKNTVLVTQLLLTKDSKPSETIEQSAPSSEIIV